MLMRLSDKQGKLIKKVKDHDVPIAIRRAERIQIGGQAYAIDSVGRVELDEKREVIFRPVHLRSPN